MKLTQQIVRELISYDPATGICRWNYRDVKWFKREGDCSRWNNNYAGTIIGFSDDKRRFKARLLGKTFMLHRLIWFYMTGEWPNVIDHIDGDGFNNRWENLRDVTQIENVKNCKISSRNTSGVTGVSWCKNLKKWKSHIRVDKNLIYLGIFPCIAHAVRARKGAEIKYGFHQNHGRRK